ncbi:MAG: hypothetical protein HRU28_16360 [Rhizobiales bacterium]|nr:hypothetical protein [Hyphomicrobiales bacterium]
MPENHSLFILGDFEAQELVKYFGGETLNIAMNILTPHERYNLIEKLAKSGKSINQIALDAGCTTRRVLQIKSQLLLANDNKEPAQKSLFD